MNNLLQFFRYAFGRTTMSHYNDTSRKTVTIRTLHRKKKAGTPITMLTAYDFSSATLCDRAGVDMLLIGDSLAQVMLGMEDTVSLTMDEMVMHCRSVARGAKHSFLVADMPFMTYNITIEAAIRNAGRLIQEGRVHAVKIEGGAERADTIRSITHAGIPVVGHIGFTPQTVSQLSGYRIQGRTGDSAFDIYQDALALQAAGCVAIVLEMVPGRVAAQISRLLRIPTIGIGAGAECDGQVLVYHDLLGLLDIISARFVKQYINLGELITNALGDYVVEVESRAFPAEQHTYTIKDAEFEKFVARLNSAEPTP